MVQPKCTITVKNHCPGHFGRHGNGSEVVSPVVGVGVGVGVGRAFPASEGAA